jgi:hypothetical protein
MATKQYYSTMSQRNQMEKFKISQMKTEIHHSKTHEKNAHHLWP